MKRISRRRLLAQATTATVAAAGVGLSNAHAQTTPFPSRPIRILVGFAAGGGNDVVARIVTQKLSEGPLGPVLVDNRTGASGLIAADMLAKSSPDGTTLMVASQTTYAVAPVLYAKTVTFDATRDVTGVAMLGASPLVLVVHPSFAAKTVRELIDIAKARPGELNFGSGGVGTTPHMAGEQFLFDAGIRMTHVPYRGEAPAIIDLLAGQLPAMFANLSAVTGHLKSGTLRGLAVTSRNRAPGYPDLPTIAESGLPGFEVETWFGLTAAAATPREIVQRLNAEVLKALAAPDLQKRFADLSLTASPGTPEALNATIKAEIARARETISRAGIKAAD
ncbi:MAG: tripartite tricarboxylate transporter substrate binding protein [Rhodospirillaceae bacterium]|nr:tripartite tricarboxylate transporter substrate binding protein [Rhodospirillaceae bacterium]